MVANHQGSEYQERVTESRHSVTSRSASDDRLESKREAALFGLISAPAGCRPTATRVQDRVVPGPDVSNPSKQPLIQSPRRRVEAVRAEGLIQSLWLS